MALSVRCVQPYQQHGRRIPSFSSETTLSTCSFLFSGVLTEIVQQIHSLRASSVMSSHAASAFRSDVRAFRKSAGISCATPPEIFFVISVVYKIRPSILSDRNLCSNSTASINTPRCVNVSWAIVTSGVNRERIGSPRRRVRLISATPNSMRIGYCGSARSNRIRHLSTGGFVVASSCRVGSPIWHQLRLPLAAL